MMKQQASVRVDIREVTTHSLVFHQDAIRRAMKTLGREVQGQARNLVHRRQASKPGEYPGQITGRLLRSISFRVSRPGFMVVVQPERQRGFGNKEFYPAFLHYGVRHDRQKSHRRHADTTTYRIAPRANYMKDALGMKSDRVRAVIFEAMQSGLRVE